MKFRTRKRKGGTAFIGPKVRDSLTRDIDNLTNDVLREEVSTMYSRYLYFNRDFDKYFFEEAKWFYRDNVMGKYYEAIKVRIQSSSTGVRFSKDDLFEKKIKEIYEAFRFLQSFSKPLDGSGMNYHYEESLFGEMSIFKDLEADREILQQLVIDWLTSQLNSLNSPNEPSSVFQYDGYLRLFTTLFNQYLDYTNNIDRATRELNLPTTPADVISSTVNYIMTNEERKSYTFILVEYEIIDFFINYNVSKEELRNKWIKKKEIFQEVLSKTKHAIDREEFFRKQDEAEKAFLERVNKRIEIEKEKQKQQKQEQYEMTRMALENIPISKKTPVSDKLVEATLLTKVSDLAVERMTQHSASKSKYSLDFGSSEFNRSIKLFTGPVTSDDMIPIADSSARSTMKPSQESSLEHSFETSIETSSKESIGSTGLYRSMAITGRPRKILYSTVDYVFNLIKGIDVVTEQDGKPVVQYDLIDDILTREFFHPFYYEGVVQLVHHFDPWIKRLKQVEKSDSKSKYLTEKNKKNIERISGIFLAIFLSVSKRIPIDSSNDIWKAIYPMKKEFYPKNRVSLKSEEEKIKILKNQIPEKLTLNESGTNDQLKGLLFKALELLSVNTPNK